MKTDHSATLPCVAMGKDLQATLSLGVSAQKMELQNPAQGGCCEDEQGPGMQRMA